MALKTIDTLVEDIYSLFKQKNAVDYFKALSMADDVLDIVIRRLQAEDREQTLRMSNLGRPDRQVWYDINGEEGQKEDLPPQASLKFLFGDLWEQVLLFLCEQAGHIVTHRQAEVEVQGIKGHPDAIIDGVVVDIKSCSSYAFKKFQNDTLRDDDAFGYIAQLAGYVHALTPGKGGAFLAVDKTTGEICLLKVSAEELQQYDIEAAATHKKEMIKGPIPERCHEAVPDGKSGNLKLPVGCSYCGHKFKCWEDANDGKGIRTFIYSTGPRFLVQVDREPDVYEVGGKDTNWPGE
jgi:hypothetical protein